MRRAAWLFTPVLVLTLAASPVRAASTPIVDVDTFGLELCPQSVCGAAIFAGFFVGQVGFNKHAIGTFVVAAMHEDLPELPGEERLLTGGVFEMRVGFRSLKGIVESGTLTNNGDNTFTVDATLRFTSGAVGTTHYLGLLDHNVFPPTVIGPMTQ
jgi:hypothetical protein